MKLNFSVNFQVSISIKIYFPLIFLFRATFSSSAKGVSPEASGDKLEDLMKQFTGSHLSPIPSSTSFLDSNVLFAFFRLTTGDALSVRTKFAFMTWIGEKG